MSRLLAGGTGRGHHGRMATDQQPAGAADPTPLTSVVEFGADAVEAQPERRRWSAAGFAMSLGSDRRVVPLAAVLGGVALFGSLVSEWQITSVDTTVFGGVQAGNRPVASGIADLGGWAGGYLAGLFVLVATTVLVLFGPVPGRRYARLVGLSGGGLLLAMLAAIVSNLGDSTRALDVVFTLALNDDQLQISYGRGIWCAVFGVAATMVALYLAGRHSLPPTGGGPGDETADGEATPESPPVVWSWRRPRDVDDDDEQPRAEPFDLTVTSTRPFTSLMDDRDKPGKRPGISG
jgi:hypothetical protein